ncbi:ABC transporter substrate-binding protein [Flavobacteriaceae bacterium XHP0103]|uniref:type IX secretion system anionic LPS delivery protein PorZ n=1 Tax=Marixanthotalea marina TaxID=2844359 RepID=UPI002989E88C|nr:two-component regulator propeller domain-containing protein [Marixanthotalea marina]MBU3820787.1 ABC transporter substrate-binding protein [Marixanthotalea marina]
MFKRIVVLVLYLFPFLPFAQDFSTLWQGHFSFNNIKDVVESESKIYAAAQNAVFSYDKQTNELEQITTVQGLSGENISTIYYSDLYELLMIGYENGLIEIVFENDEDVLTVSDIVDKVTIPPNNKRVNHFNAIDNVVYVATNYGISVFDLDRLEFGDTYYIGDTGNQLQVTQTTIFNDEIYASCLGGNGIRKAPVSSPNLIDYQNWQTIISGNFSAIQTVSDKLYTTRTDRRIFQIENNVLSERFQYSNPPLDLKEVNGNLVVTTINTTFVYNSDFVLISQAGVNPSFSTQFSSATIDTEYIYIGTKDFGVLKTPLANLVEFEEIHPEGPLLNTPFSLQTTPNNLWVTYGDYDIFFNPYPLNSLGYSHLNGEEWINTPFSELLTARCLNAISINPFNNNQVFISSFVDGLLEINDGVPTILYDDTNSGLEPFVINANVSDIRVGPNLFDGNGLLWTLTSRVDRPLKSYNPLNNQWKSYSFTSIIQNNNPGFGDMVIGNDGAKWIASYNGFIGFKENSNGFLIKKVFSEEDNMPSDRVTALAIDKRNQLWIGTYRGLRVLYNTSNFFEEDDVKVDDIIISEDGIAKELLFQQIITDIEVDGSNNKWIGTVSSGIFYVSSNGQQTIYHFTKDNSPLPSNEITDIALDESDGKVYIATSKGLVSFSSGSSATLETLENAYAYPNPVRPNFDIAEERVKIKGVSENVNIKITDIEGNLVAEAQSRINLRYRGYNLEIDGGTAYWNGKNLANNVVKSGVYLVMLSDLDTYETKVLKLMVVR